MDAFEVCEHLVVPKSQNPITLVLQEGGPFDFRRRQGIVLPAVDLHNQSGFMAHEIGDVTTEGYLAAKLAAAHLLGAERLPEPPFRLCHIPS
ncbi:MAG TPA: hypothetical protein VG651_03700 [Stellaceae bacterium]|nr:hypothetical protein [Stellaceae bacterium]